MRKYLVLTLVLGGCVAKADEPTPPPPLFLKVRLQPAIYTNLSWTEQVWTLLRGLGRLRHPDLCKRVLDGQRYFPTQNWLTLYQNTRPRFILEEKQDQLRILSVSVRPDSEDEARAIFQEFAQIPMPLQPGLTWDSRRVEPTGVTLDRASCRAERLETHDGGRDALRVDFVKSGEIRSSLWFGSTGGLLRWDGITAGCVFLAPGSPAPFQLGVAAASYASYGRVDEVRRWAPEMCAGPPEPPLRTSASRDEATHGRKQYYLFALDRDAYLRARNGDQPDGQIIVKESWFPPPIEKTGYKNLVKAYETQRLKGPLFIMLKHDGEWTYATATADGKTITASGRIASCVECHESDRTRDRMFGLQPSTGAYKLEGVPPSND